jgi:ribosomal protein S5
LAGIKDIVSKSLGASNPLNVARATVLALSQFRVKLNGRQSETIDGVVEQESVAVADSASDSEVPDRV